MPDSRLLSSVTLALFLAACSPDSAPPMPPEATTAAADSSGTSQQTATAVSTDTPMPTATAAAGSCADPSVDLRLVDKQRGLPEGYVPVGVVPIDPLWAVPGLPEQMLLPDSAAAIVRLLEAAEAGRAYDAHPLHLSFVRRTAADVPILD